MKLSIIAALATNKTIGKNNRLPWHLPSDLKRFKKLTMGHHLIMGRKTFESIGRPLPGRTTIVLTRKSNFCHPGVLCAHDPSEAINLVIDDEEVFIAGGAQVYEIFMEMTDRMYLTMIHKDFDGDTYFPSFDETQWSVIESEDFQEDNDAAFSYSFVTLDRLLTGR